MFAFIRVNLLLHPFRVLLVFGKMGLEPGKLAGGWLIFPAPAALTITASFTIFDIGLIVDYGSPVSFWIPGFEPHFLARGAGADLCFWIHMEVFRGEFSRCLQFCSLLGIVLIRFLKPFVALAKIQISNLSIDLAFK